MDLERVAPELRAKGARQPSFTGMRSHAGRLLARTAVRAIRWPVVPGVDVSVARVHRTRVRTYRPSERRGDAALLWIHGGGMVGGAPPMDDLLCSEVASRLGILVVSADYRLAPEHPFPTALDDCAAIWTAMQRRAARVGVDPARIVIGGQSAGGGIAAGLVQRLHDEGGRQPLGQWLFSPMLDDRTAADTTLDATDHFVWNNALNRFGWTSLLGHAPGASPPPRYAAPARREALAGLPPTWIGVGDIDLFHDEDASYARRLADAGVAVTTEIVPGAPHGFESLVPDAAISREYRLRAQQWLATLLSIPLRQPLTR